MRFTEESRKTPIYKLRKCIKNRRTGPRVRFTSVAVSCNTNMGPIRTRCNVIEFPDAASLLHRRREDTSCNAVV